MKNQRNIKIISMTISCQACKREVVFPFVRAEGDPIHVWKNGTSSGIEFHQNLLRTDKSVTGQDKYGSKKYTCRNCRKKHHGSR